jgi:hypothetical protein
MGSDEPECRLSLRACGFAAEDSGDLFCPRCSEIVCATAGEKEFHILRVSSV